MRLTSFSNKKMVVQIGVYDLKHLTSSLLALADNNIMNLDDGSRLRALEKSQKDIIEVISKIRESEPRAGAIDKDTVKHLDKRGYTFYQVRARGKQIKCADYKVERRVLETGLEQECIVTKDFTQNALYDFEPFFNYFNSLFI